ncbi:hypothetical protein EYF80_052276 [Liparis tanakae]|uniref:Uncharacterized protein n=1 Tax=Liparis tanakae TaxID=230148 RepID=A0A4Z2F9A7_9TELE|nr:hypothetical protein EYF80_052276 [Liparis tanakae]
MCFAKSLAPPSGEKRYCRELLAGAPESPSCFCRFLALISFMASSMERVSLLLATGTEGATTTRREPRAGGAEGRRRHGGVNRARRAARGLTAAVRAVGLQRVRRVLGGRGADQVAVLVPVVGVGTRLRLLRPTGLGLLQRRLLLKRRKRKTERGGEESPSSTA